MCTYLDAGEEIRRPIDEVIDIIYEHGYFYVVQEGLHTKNQCCGQIGELCVDGTTPLPPHSPHTVTRKLSQGLLRRWG